jgi:hypothetical protein
MTKVRKGPNCASTGLAHDALAGVKHSPAFSRRAQRRIAGGLVRRQVVHDDEQPAAAGPGGPDRLQRGQGAAAALVLAGHAPQLVIAQGMAAVEVRVTDQAGTASRPLRVQRGQSPGAERADHVPDGILIRRDQPRDLLQPLTLLICQPPRPHQLSHPASRHSIHLTIECESFIRACQPTGERL